METLAQVVERLIDQGALNNAVRNPMIMFGTRNRPLLGAELLPNREVPENMYQEEKIQWRTIVANDGTRYSPVQYKNGARYGSFTVKLEHQDIGSQMTSREHDAIIRYLRQTMSMEAAATALNWFENVIIMGLEEKIEVQRWQAIVDAQVILKGDDGYTDVVQYSNPPGHRVTIASGTVASPAGWYDPTHDPMDDIQNTILFQAQKGYTINRIICSRRIAYILVNHPKMLARRNQVVFVGNQVQTVRGSISLQDLGSIFASDNLPQLEIYDTYYNTDTGTARFLRDTAFVMLATTGMNEEVLMTNSDLEPFELEETIGYCAIGRPAGEAMPGRAWNMTVNNNKPRVIDAQAWQAQSPVIMAPEAIMVLNIPYPTP